MKRNIIVIFILQILNINVYASALSNVYASALSNVYASALSIASSSTTLVKNEEQLTKRILYNATENKTLYAVWCQITNPRTGALTVVTKVQDVAPHTPEVLTQPSDRNIKANLRLVLSFDEKAMRTEEGTHFLIATATNSSLKVMQVSELTDADEYLIFSITRASTTPYYNPKTLRTLKNITHENLYCAAYETDPKGKSAASRIGSGVITLPAHQTRFVSFEDKGADNDLCFCVSDDEDNLDTNLNSHQMSDLSPIVVSCSSKDKATNDKVKNDKEFFIIPHIMVDSPTSSANGHPSYTIIGSSEISRDLFLIDQLVERFHELPQLTTAAKAVYDKKIKDGIEYHDRNFSTKTNEASLPRKLDSTSLSDIQEEKDFVVRRKNVIKKGLKKLFEKEIKDKSFPDFPDIKGEDFDIDELLPSIAFVSTGGGYRAMVETIGFLEGAQEKDVLDCCMFMCGLSGSTWAINSLVASKQPTISNFADVFKKKVTKKTTQVTEEGALARAIKKLADSGKLAEDNPYYGLFKLVFALSDSEGYKLCKYIQELYGQHQGFVGLYGHALVEALLNDAELNSKNSPHSIMLSDLRAALKGSNPMYPLPISVCLHSPENANSDSQWLEFTPYTVGMYDMIDNYILWHIPTYTFGSYYLENSLVHRIPEYPLGQLFGIFGSAMGISDSTLADYKSMRARSLLKMIQYMKANHIGITFNEKRMTAGVVPNFLYQGEPPIVKKKHGIFYEKKLRLVDGGMLSTQDELGTNCHNFATMPAVQRKCDVLILVDCSARSNEENNKRHLKAFYDIAAQKRFPLPGISDEQFNKMKTKSALFYDDDLDTPSLVYMLGQRHDEAVERFETDSSNNKKTATAYFAYSEETYTGLHDVAKELFMAEKNIKNIKKAILISMNKKKKSLPTSQSAVKASKPTSAAPLPELADSDEDEKDSSDEVKINISRNVDNDDDDDKPPKKGSGKKKKKDSHGKKDSNPKPGDIVLPMQNVQQFTVESVDHDDSSESDDNSKMKASRTSKAKKSSRKKKTERTPRKSKQRMNNVDDNGDSEDSPVNPQIASSSTASVNTSPTISSQATSSNAVTWLLPVPNSAFDSFKQAFPDPKESDSKAMKDMITSLLEEKPYEFFADFMNYAASHNSIDLIEFIMEKADASSNHPTDDLLKKIYAIIKQEIMVVGAKEDILYCHSNESNPLHKAAEHKNTKMFKILLYKNMFALGCRNQQKQTPLHTAFIHKAQGCVEEALHFFEEIDSITIDNPRHTEMLQGLVTQIFTTRDDAQKAVTDYAKDLAIKKRIRRILIKYYISSGL